MKKILWTALMVLCMVIAGCMAVDGPTFYFRSIEAFDEWAQEHVRIYNPPAQPVPQSPDQFTPPLPPQ